MSACPSSDDSPNRPDERSVASGAAQHRRQCRLGERRLLLTEPFPVEPAVPIEGKQDTRPADDAHGRPMGELDHDGDNAHPLPGELRQAVRVRIAKHPAELRACQASEACRGPGWV
jgi:hypothetical protein